MSGIVVLSPLNTPGFLREIAARSHRAAIEELVTVVEALELPGFDRDVAVHSVLTRESRQSTSSGFGEVHPHGRLPGLGCFVVVIARSPPGISWPATLDGRPVDLVRLTLGPDGAPQAFLDLHAVFAAISASEDARRTMKTGSSAALSELLRRRGLPEFLGDAGRGIDSPSAHRTPLDSRPRRDGESIVARVVLVNRQGLHASPSKDVVQTAVQFESEVELTRLVDGLAANGKSIIEVMMIAGPTGTEYEVSACGPDAEEALAALVTLFESGFGERG